MQKKRLQFFSKKYYNFAVKEITIFQEKCKINYMVRKYKYFKFPEQIYKSNKTINYVKTYKNYDTHVVQKYNLFVVASLQAFGQLNMIVKMCREQGSVS